MGSDGSIEGDSIYVGAGSGDIEGYGNFSGDGYAIEGDGYI